MHLIVALFCVKQSFFSLPVLQDPFQDKTIYHDNLIDKLFVRIFASKMAEQLGPVAHGKMLARTLQHCLC